ncbi:MAG TPA: hypothetical protein VHD87_01645 [Acidimicrobiales bacterium]|nr:hypothetical protein [Acidimicrobiales bacterium]
MTTADQPDDPISAASSGLLALGVAPQRRVETLGLLSALIDLADEDGAVALDNDLMATEERLGIDACLEGYEWLERLDVIRRTYSGWEIQNFASHHGPAGMAEAAMDVLARHLRPSEAEAPTAEVPLASVTPLVLRAAVPAEPVAAVVPLASWRRRIPVVAASVAAGVAVIAGASQFVPQAAVTGRNVAANRAEGVAATAPPPSSVAVPSQIAAGVATTAVTPSTAAAATNAPAQATTTTSTTLLPNLPCLGDVIRDLGSRTGLHSTRSTQDGGGLLPCP